MKALPTTYNNIVYKSRLEARFAEELDEHNIEWLYESEKIGKAEYLVSFYLPKLSIWVEVKEELQAPDKKDLSEVADNLSERDERLFVFMPDGVAYWVKPPDFISMPYYEFWSLILPKIISKIIVPVPSSPRRKLRQKRSTSVSQIRSRRLLRLLIVPLTFVLCFGIAYVVLVADRSNLNKVMDMIRAIPDSGAAAAALQVIAEPSLIMITSPCNSATNARHELAHGQTVPIKSYYLWANGTLWWEVQPDMSAASTQWVADNAQRTKVAGVSFTQGRPQNVPLNAQYTPANCPQ